VVGETLGEEEDDEKGDDSVSAELADRRFKHRKMRLRTANHLNKEENTEPLNTVRHY